MVSQAHHTGAGRAEGDEGMKGETPAQIVKRFESFMKDMLAAHSFTIVCGCGKKFDSHSVYQEHLQSVFDLMADTFPPKPTPAHDAAEGPKE